MKNILVLTDFSGKANFVAEFAINMASAHKSNLIFCHVIEGNDAISVMKRKRDGQTSEYEHTLDLIDRLDNFSGIINKTIKSGSHQPRIQCIVDSGSFPAVAEKIVADKAIDLVIIGSKKANCVTGFQFGSQTYTLPDQLKCPVLLVPEGLKFEGIQIIMYATDLPLNNQKALQFLGELAKPFKASLKVSHISKTSQPDKVSDNVITSSLNEQLGHGYPTIVYKTLKEDNINAGLLRMTGSGKVNILALVHRKYEFLEGLFHESLSKFMPDKFPIPLLILPNSFISQDPI